MTHSVSLAIDEVKKTIQANSGEPVQFTDREIKKAYLATSDLIVYETTDGIRFGRSFYLNGDVITLTTEVEMPVGS